MEAVAVLVVLLLAFIFLLPRFWKERPSVETTVTRDLSRGAIVTLPDAWAGKRVIVIMLEASDAPDSDDR